jgi:hypothetical protein
MVEFEFLGFLGSFKSFFGENWSVDICTFGILREAWGHGLAGKLL